MGEPDHAQPSYRGDPILPGIRGRSLSPPEIIMGSPRVQSFDESAQEQLRHEDVDFIDEHRGEQQSVMHCTTRRSGATTNGLCIVGSLKSGTWS
jgi:hypothetical protein